MDIELKDFSHYDDDIMTIATKSLLLKRENDELPTDTFSSRFGPTITDAVLAKQRFERIPPPKKKNRRSCGVVVKLLACGTRGPGFDSRSRRYDVRDWYLLLPSRNMAERSLKRRKSSTTNNNRKN